MKSHTKNNSNKIQSPFSKKMKTLAIGIVLCGMALITPFVWSSASKPSSTIFFGIANAVEVAVWIYLSAILFQFYKRTQLREYILNVHTFWLAGIIAYPLSYIFGGILHLFQNAIQSSLYTSLGILISGIWLVLFVVGKVISQHREDQFQSEIKRNSTIWNCLLRMNYKGIASLKFPKNTKPTVKV